jgi:hypothetical protein
MDEIAEAEGRNDQLQYSRYEFQHMRSPALKVSPQAIAGRQAFRLVILWRFRRNAAGTP